MHQKKWITNLTRVSNEFASLSNESSSRGSYESAEARVRVVHRSLKAESSEPDYTVALRRC